jgi:hypothetical protein
MSNRYVGLAVVAVVSLAALVGALVLQQQQPAPAPTTASQAQQQAGQAQLPTRQASINSSQLTLEVASTSQARIHGLSNRLELPADHGMLFVFEARDRHRIWMKDMQFPLDILWLDEQLSVVDMKANARPASYPETIFRPDEAARYVLELNAGSIERYEIERGTVLQLHGGENYPHR